MKNYSFKFTTHLPIKRAIFLVLLILTFITIFSLSSQNGEESGSLSQKVTEIIVKALANIKIISQNNIENVIEKLHPIIRKLAHFSIYMLVGFSIMGFLCTFKIKDANKIIISIITSNLYAVSDEIHQSFIPGRGPTIGDVVIDTLGAILGIVIIIIYFNICTSLKRKRNLI